MDRTWTKATAEPPWSSDLIRPSGTNGPWSVLLTHWRRVEPTDYDDCPHLVQTAADWFQLGVMGKIWQNNLVLSVRIFTKLDRTSLCLNQHHVLWLFCGHCGKILGTELFWTDVLVNMRDGSVVDPNQNIQIRISSVLETLRQICDIITDTTEKTFNQKLRLFLWSVQPITQIQIRVSEPIWLTPRWSFTMVLVHISRPRPTLCEPTPQLLWQHLSVLCNNNWTTYSLFSHNKKPHALVWQSHTDLMTFGLPFPSTQIWGSLFRPREKKRFSNSETWVKLREQRGAEPMWVKVSEEFKAGTMEGRTRTHSKNWRIRKNKTVHAEPSFQSLSGPAVGEHLLKTPYISSSALWKELHQVSCVSRSRS